MLTIAGQDIVWIGRNIEELGKVDHVENKDMRICMVGLTKDMDLVCLAYRPGTGDFVVGRGMSFNWDADPPRAYWVGGVYDLTLGEALGELEVAGLEAELWYSKEYMAYRGI